MAARWILAIAVFLGFTADATAEYANVWGAPFGWATTFLYEALPYKIRFFDHLTVLALFLAPKKGKAAVVQPMRKALLGVAVTLLICFLYGVARGGSAWAASWQIYLLASGVLFAFSVAAVCRTPDDFTFLAKAIMWAAAYRALMCWLFYLYYVRVTPLSTPLEYLTTHDDTVLWVTVMLVLILGIFETPGLGKRFKYALFYLFLTGAVFFNQRRLAWVSLIMGLVAAIALMRPGSKGRKRALRIAMGLAPVIAIYVAVGWGRPGIIFKPLQSFQTVTTQEDASTKARNAENLGLIATSNQSNIVLGTGWGHPYVEVSSKYSIAAYFPLWQYIPHNSVLGFLAYTGVFGFLGYWMPLPVSVFLNSRMARLAESAALRRLGIMGVIQAIVCANQFYGDMGSYYPKSVYMLAISYAIALRLPIVAGVWGAKSKRRRASQPAPAPAPAPVPEVG